MKDTVAAIKRDARRTLFSALLRARSRFGGNREILIDADGRVLTYTEIVRAALALGRALTRHTKRGDVVGVMLPTGAGATIAFFALLAYGRIPAMINFTAGPRNIISAIRTGQIKTVVTAHAFIEIGNLEALAQELGDHAELLHLEDVRETLTPVDRAFAVIGPFLPWLTQGSIKPDAPGVILFTSGTEGDPKGVVLTHGNILANISQINHHFQLDPSDIIFNPLPVFHCYGLTGGTLLGLLSGYQIVLHPSPLQVKIIPKRIKETQATLMFATDSFLQQYARASDDDDLQSIRYAVLGAERVRDETRAMAKRRFNLDIFEGYGVTEAAPVIAVNVPGATRNGTVGQALPGVETRLEPVEGLEGAGGRLFVRGPNVMVGYLSTDEPGKIRDFDPDGWHDTGDVVSIDADGYITIRDRVKRFAKISGEMISLAVVENCASAIWPDYLHAAVTVPDPRRGEQIILVTEYPGANHSDMVNWFRTHGVSSLAIPKKVVVVESIPLLGTGKINHGEVATLAKEDEAQGDGAQGDGAQGDGAQGDGAKSET